jgi:ankyrin repeat protein
MLQKTYIFLLLSSVVYCNHLHAIDTNDNSGLFVSEITEQDSLESLLTAIEEDDVHIIETCLNRYPKHLNYYFEKELTLYAPTKIMQKNFIITPLILAIALGKINAVKCLIEHGAKKNESINGHIPFLFTASIVDLDIRKKMTQVLIESGAIGNTPTDLLKCTNLIENICQDKKIKSNPQKIISHENFSQVIEILEKNPSILFVNVITTIEREQVLNSTFKRVQIIDLLKTAILMDLPWLASFFITIKKMLKPNINPVNQKISNYFNVMDYVSFDENEQMLDIFLAENPLISDHFMYNDEWIQNEQFKKCCDLYTNQSDEITMDLEDPINPCIQRRLLPKTPANLIFSPEVESKIYTLFTLVENEEDTLNIDVQIETLKTILDEKKDPVYLNSILVTTEQTLTTKGYTTGIYYHTLLSTAIIRENFPVVKLLIEAGADVNQYLVQQIELIPLTTLHYAALQGNKEIVHYLLSKGAIITPLIQKDMKAFMPDIRDIIQEYLNKTNVRDTKEEILIEPVSHKRNREVNTPTLLSPATKRIRES